jgi:ubiquinone/menaquinone biosynthesis C-methylase UbiE
MTETSPPAKPNNHIAADFDALAETYDILRFVQVCAERLVERVILHPGAQALDIATGSGWVALAAGRSTGPTGRVVGIDLAPQLLEYARQKAATVGLTQVEFQVGDAQRLDFEDRSFDIVLCASSIFFFPDVLAALQEWHRVLKPGGQVGFSTFGPGFRQPLAARWNAHLRRSGVNLPKGSPLQGMTEPETCRRLLHEVGFMQTEVQREQLGYYLTLEEYWEEAWSSLHRIDLLQLSPAQHERFKAEHLAEMRDLADEGGIWVNVPAIFSHGWKRR